MFINFDRRDKTAKIDKSTYGDAETRGFGCFVTFVTGSRIIKLSQYLP